MNWVHVPTGDMLKALKALHVEVVLNAVPNIAQRQDISCDEIEQLLTIIEDEEMAVAVAAKTKDDVKTTENPEPGVHDKATSDLDTSEKPGPGVHKVPVEDAMADLNRFLFDMRLWIGVDGSRDDEVVQVTRKNIGMISDLMSAIIHDDVWMRDECDSVYEALNAAKGRGVCEALNVGKGRDD